jgi:amino acid adenylation domain-containing protein
MNKNSFLILKILLDSIRNYPDRQAFYIDGNSYTYQHFHRRIAAIQKHIFAAVDESEKYVGVLTYDHPDTYASLFAVWFSGKAFVPLNPLNPAARNHEIINRMELRYVLSSRDPAIPEINSSSSVLNTSVLEDMDSEIQTIVTSHQKDAYVLFTSGSTGLPKGVRINRRNIDAFYRSYISFGPLYTHTDRFLQIYDISFDGSIPCYLVALCTGAAVYTVPQDEIRYLYALKLMKEQDLTVVKMTPSTLFYLRPYFDRIHLPQVRVCIFGGESLPLEIIEEWMNCVPNAIIQNAYGPTEATIDSLMYNFNSGEYQGKSEAGIISLGRDFGDFQYAVITPDGTPVNNREQGELCLHGSQVMSGYWNDEEKTLRAFIQLETSDGIKKFYRTGDLVSRDSDGFFMVHGRIDNQVQIQGYRVELGEIELHARNASGRQNLAAVPTRNKNGNTEIVLFIGGDEMPKQAILSRLQIILPHYMIPSKIFFIKEIPQLSSGKIDRKVLSEIAERHEIH